MSVRGYVLVLFFLVTIACHQDRNKDGDLFRLAVQYEVPTLDPHALNKVSSLAVLSNFYEPLVRTEANMLLRPCLASLWENTDPVTWVFHLRKDVRFSNGKKMDSGDVVYSFRRLLKKGSNLELSGYVSNVESVSARDKFTVIVRTQRPVSILLNKVSFVMIIPENVNPDQLKETIVG